MLQRIRVVQVVPRIAAESSGPSLSVPSLSESLVKAGCEVELLCLEPAAKSALFPNTHYFRSSRFPGAYRLGASSSLFSYLKDSAISTDIIHTNSLWMMPNIYPAKAVRGTNCKLVVSPRGTLSKWALRRSPVRKWFVKRLGQWRCLAAADCIHATSEQEYQEIRDAGFKNPVAVLPNGVEVPELPNNPIGDSSVKTLLYLARIHPKKGIDILLRIWQTIEKEFPDWQLKVVGPIDSDFAREMQGYGLGLPRVVFTGELQGEEKRNAFLQSHLYILPTYSENFGISVAESLAHGVPAIVTEGAPWSGLRLHHAGWWVRMDVASLAQKLKDAMSLPTRQLEIMGQNGRQWIVREFDWNRIGQEMLAVYCWLTGVGCQPQCVRID